MMFLVWGFGLGFCILHFASLALVDRHLQSEFMPLRASKRVKGYLLFILIVCRTIADVDRAFCIAFIASHPNRIPIAFKLWELEERTFNMNEELV